MLTDLYVRDKHTGDIHRVGSDNHDGLWVDHTGTVHYMHLQNGDGCGPDHPENGYEFIKTDCGYIPPGADLEEFVDFAKQCLPDDEYSEFEKALEKQRKQVEWEPGVKYEIH